MCFLFVNYRVKIFIVFPLSQFSPKDNARQDNTVSWQKLVATPGCKPRLQSSPTSNRNPPASSALITSSGRSRFKTYVKKSALIISFTCLSAFLIRFKHVLRCFMLIKKEYLYYILIINTQR